MVTGYVQLGLAGNRGRRPCLRQRKRHRPPRTGARGMTGAPGQTVGGRGGPPGSRIHGTASLRNSDAACTAAGAITGAGSGQGGRGESALDAASRDRARAEDRAAESARPAGSGGQPGKARRRRGALAFRRDPRPGSRRRTARTAGSCAGSAGLRPIWRPCSLRDEPRQSARAPAEIQAGCERRIPFRAPP